MNDPLQQGLRAAQARRPAEAARWFGQAAARDPGNVQIRTWLGQALCASGAYRDGVTQLKGAGLALAPGPADRAKALEIAVQLQALTALPEAIAVLDRILAADPGNAHAHYLRAVGLAQINRPADALAAGREAIRLAPDNPGVRVLLASLEADAGLFGAAAERLDALLASGTGPREAHRAHKELARIADRRGDYDAAFAHLEQAAAAAAAVPDLAALDRALVPRLIDEAAAGYTAESMARWRGHDFGDRAAPLFVIGFYRSGTTMTQQVLAAHPDAVVADEVGLVQSMLGELDAIVPGTEPAAARLARLDAAGVARLRARYWATARGRFGTAIDRPLFVDKFTLNTVDVGLIATVFPDAKLLFMVRDPRDVCLSAFMQLMPPSAATAHLLTWQGTADFYAKVMTWWLAVRDQLSLDWIELRYEDVIADFGGSYRRVLDLAGLPWDPALERFHERAAGQFISTPSRGQVSQPLYATAVARWRRYEPHYAEVAATLAPFVGALGYPP